MAVKLPSVSVTFIQLAGSLIERSERGIAILVVRDETTDTPYVMYNSIADVDEEAYTKENMQYIRDVLSFAPYKFAVIRIKEADAFAKAAKIITARLELSTGWISIADMTTQDSEDLASWIKAQENEKKTYKAVTYKAAVTDSMHIVNFYNDNVVFADESRGEQPGETYLPSLLGIIASCNIRRGCTYFICSNLSSVEELEDNQEAVGEGKFILINDRKVVRIAVGINSLVTTNGRTLTEDMKYIETVECMDIIADDIRDVFLNVYCGNYRNIYDNQMLFIAAVNHYFRELAKEYILDPNYNNHAEIDVNAQRSAWLGVGKHEAEEWTDLQVKLNSFKRTVYLAGDIKIVGSMEHLMFEVSMF